MNLTKSVRVYERHDTPDNVGAAVVTFVQLNDDAPDTVLIDSAVTLEREDYEAMGEPDYLTVTLQPGDLLNGAGES